MLKKNYLPEATHKCSWLSDDLNLTFSRPSPTLYPLYNIIGSVIIVLVGPTLSGLLDCSERQILTGTGGMGASGKNV